MKTILAFEGIPTADGRIIEHGALYWDGLPLWILNDGNEQVGHITNLERVANIIWATTDIIIPEEHVLSLSGGAAEIKYQESDVKVVFEKMEIIGGMILPTEKWAWK